MQHPHLTVTLTPMLLRAVDRAAVEAGLSATMWLRALAAEHLAKAGKVDAVEVLRAQGIRRTGGRPRPVVVRGRRFPSIRAAADALNLSPAAVWKAHRAGRLDEVGVARARRRAKALRSLYEMDQPREDHRMAKLSDEEIEAQIASFDEDTRERYARQPSSARYEHAEAARLLHARHVAAFEASSAAQERRARDLRRRPEV